jgi:4-hydroxybenzoyl-CoA thioesterase
VTSVFRLSQPLRFAHCDPAGIGYYPAYLELCDGAIEDWTVAALGVSRRVMHFELRLGLPTVDLHARFSRPGRLGDLLDIDVSVRKVGRSSVGLVTLVTCEGEPRFEVELVQVLTDLDTMRARPWPQEWRERLAKIAEKETSA